MPYPGIRSVSPDGFSLMGEGQESKNREKDEKQAKGQSVMSKASWVMTDVKKAVVKKLSKKTVIEKKK
ncbi:hypothetical protein L198_01853 [Cryptococcus wingfieldii CBS 7118]|uniref:Uncharacterized protein n=1 Tax=Cryptococcus wingfieldii CBS 7118 TaxID=1295528 RepID=A0A1E3JWE1_9TREE|nr:hypothetical protein L198_01853 [Cryptococcus wingfieldii CBS 7118]ODO05165.1 hypothetical protein L198_01853 [Cryptococcus wingfieldii CBS 7118]